MPTRRARAGLVGPRFSRRPGGRQARAARNPPTPRHLPFSRRRAAPNQQQPGSGSETSGAGRECMETGETAADSGSAGRLPAPPRHVSVLDYACASPPAAWPGAARGYTACPIGMQCNGFIFHENTQTSRHIHTHKQTDNSSFS